MTNKISMDKKYRTRSGITIRRVLCTDGAASYYPVVAETVEGRIVQYDTRGNAAGGAYSLDLIEVSPYEDFKIDDPVMVKVNSCAGWYRRYFAGIAPDGKPMAFVSGCDSWTSHKVVERWDECRKPTAEELAK